LLQRMLSRRLPKPTPKTITDRRALLAELERVRKRGWAAVPDEGMIGFNALAVPIFDAQQNLTAMVGVIGPTRLLPAPAPTDIIESLLRTEVQIASALGLRGTDKK
jgi:IclR family transcriptional regulator, KDG regulon repressor